MLAVTSLIFKIHYANHMSPFFRVRQSAETKKNENFLSSIRGPQLESSTFVLSKKNDTTKKIGKCVVFRNYAASKG